MTCRTGKKRLKAKRIKRQPKIGWHKLGIEAFVREKLPTPIEEIRREVIRLASRGIKQRVRPVVPAMRAPEPLRRRRRGATE